MKRINNVILGGVYYKYQGTVKLYKRGTILGYNISGVRFLSGYSKKGGGYKSYYKNFVRLGNIIDIIDDNYSDNFNDIITNNIFSRLEGEKVYRLLLTVKYESDGIVRGSSPMVAIMITKNIESILVLDRIKRELLRFKYEYNLENFSGECYLGWKEWLSEEEYKKENVDKVISEVLCEDKKLKNNFNKISDEIINGSVFNYINELFPSFNSINNYESIDNYVSGDCEIKSIIGNIKLYINDFNCKDNFIKHNNRDIKFIIKNVYYLRFKGFSNYVLLFVYESVDNELIRYNCITDLKSWNIVRDSWSDYGYPFSKWIDTFVDDNNYIRKIDPYVLYMFNNGDINYLDRYYKFPDFIFPYKDKIINRKIGSIDLETMINRSIDCENDNVINELNLVNDIDDNINIDRGMDMDIDIDVDDINNNNIKNINNHLEVYAGGWKLNNLDENSSDDIMKTFIIDNVNIHNSTDLFKIMFEDLFNLDVNGYTLYAHNLGRFDGIFLVKELAKLGYNVDPLWNNNAILKIKISDAKSKQSINILDSFNIVNSSLKSLLIGFGCKQRKGVFPHLFVNTNTLNYVGRKPDIKYYGLSDISKIEYNEISEYNWNLKEECLNYLNSDIEGLLEIINMLKEYTFIEYKVDITKYMTKAKLSLAIFGINFYDSEKYNIKMIKGPIEKYIRLSYTGGNVNCVYDNIEKYGDADGVLTDGIHLDMNSQYPNAMKNEMPLGDPIFSTNKDLNYYSGFVYAKITPPTKERLKVLYIQYRDEEGKISCPRESFIRWIDSIELKSSIEDGYKADVYCGITFPESKEVDSENLFSTYIDHFYEKKKNAKNETERSSAKLNLNTLYGKFGQKEIESKMKVVNLEEGRKIMKKFNFNYFSKISENLFLIKYSNRINEKLRKLFKENMEDEKIEKFISKDRGVFSAVQISSRIAALARVSINKFKNNEGIILIYSDTDSLIILKNGNLPDNMIGEELGQWKIEGNIKKGIFVRPKLYMYEDINGKVKKVAAGINANDLTIEDYKDLYKGKSKTVFKDKLNINWKFLEISLNKHKITIQKK